MVFTNEINFRVCETVVNEFTNNYKTQRFAWENRANVEIVLHSHSAAENYTPHRCGLPLGCFRFRFGVTASGSSFCS